MKDKLEKFGSAELIKNYSFYTIGNIIYGIAQFLLIPIYTKNFPPNEYGQIELILIASSFFSTILNFGLPTILMVEYYKLDKKGKIDLVNNILRAYLYISLPIYIIITVFFRYYKLKILKTTELPNGIIIMAFVSNFLYLLFLLYLTLLQLQKKSIKYSIVRIIVAFLVITTNLILLNYFKLDIRSFFLSSLISYLIIALFVYVGNRNKINLGHFSQGMKTSFSLIKSGFPFMLASIPFFLIMVIDRWILLFLLSDYEVGLYASAIRFGQGYELAFIIPFVTAYTPHIFERFTKGDFYQNYRIIILGSITLFTIFAFGTIFIAKIMVGREYYQSLNLIPIIIYGYMFYFINQFFRLPLTYLKKSNYLILNTSLALITNVVANIILIKLFRLEGVAIAFLLSNLSWVIITFLQNKYFYRMKSRSLNA